MAKGKIKRQARKNSRNWQKYLLITLLASALVLLLFKSSSNKNNETQNNTITQTPPEASITPAEPSIYPTRQMYLPDAESTSTATQLVNDYFTSYKNPSISDNERLEAYTVEKVTGTKTRTSLFIEVKYAVKPIRNDSFWLAGNGGLSNDGWVRGKYGCTSVKESNGSYGKIEGFGTGCGMPE